MEKEFVTLDLALRLKALGFKERVLTYYEDGKPTLYPAIEGWDFNTSFITCVSRPTYQQVFSWFRGKDFHTSVESYHCLGKDRPFGLGIDHKSNGIWDYVEYSGDGNFDTYEEAQLKAVELILEVLEKSVPC
jgi:hypothetical protein